MDDPHRRQLNWESANKNEIPLDANGWPTYLPFTASDGNQHYVHTIAPAYVSAPIPLLSMAQAKSSFKNAASATFNPAGGTNTYTINVPSGNQGPTPLFVEIHQSSAAEPIRNLRVIMPGFETTYQTQPFHPLYLERLQPFTALRFMDWGKTKPHLLFHGPTTQPPIASPRPVRREQPSNIWSSLNTLNKNLWVCIPHQADDNYVRQAARLLRDNVDPNLKSTSNTQTRHGTPDSSRRITFRIWGRPLASTRPLDSRAKILFASFNSDLGNLQR